MAENPLFVSLYLDEDVSGQLASLIRQRGFQVVSAIELGRIEIPDEDHLAFAASHQLTLFTYNEADYIKLARKWAKEGYTHAGILISDQFSLRQIGELLRRMLNFLDQVSAEEMINAFRYLVDFK